MSYDDETSFIIDPPARGMRSSTDAWAAMAAMLREAGIDAKVRRIQLGDGLSRIELDIVHTPGQPCFCDACTARNAERREQMARLHELARRRMEAEAAFMESAPPMILGPTTDVRPWPDTDPSAPRRRAAREARRRHAERHPALCTVPASVLVFMSVALFVLFLFVVAWLVMHPWVPFTAVVAAGAYGTARSVRRRQVRRVKARQEARAAERARVLKLIESGRETAVREGMWWPEADGSISIGGVRVDCLDLSEVTGDDRPA